MMNIDDKLVIKGKLEAFWETGMEGMAMLINDNENKTYDSLHWLKKGDYLKVYDSRKKIYYEGEITKEMSEPHYRPNKALIEAYNLHQSLLNKTGYQDKTWVKMFLDEMDAELIRKK